MLLLVALFFVGFAAFARARYSWALAFFIVALPSYLIRFTLGPLPTTLLELMFGILFLVWFFTYRRADWPHIKNFFQQKKYFAFFFALFFIASVIGIFVSDQRYISLGQWRAYFLEPMLFFIMVLGRWRELNPLTLIRSLIGATIPVSVVAILQKISPWFYPPSLWDDNLFGRATSFYTTPNAIGLLIVPLIFVGIPLLKTNNKNDRWFFVSAATLGLVALAFSQSVGAFAGVGAALIVLAGLLYSRRVAIVAVIIGILLLALAPTRHLLATKTVSLQNRFVLWQYSESFLTQSPNNFVFGAGIRMFFRKIQKPYYTVGGELERIIYAHNIFLNFWTEIGLAGMLAFVGILVSMARSSYQTYRKFDTLVGAGLLAALTALVVHGLVDVPYFKNDLSFAFWILACLLLCSSTISTRS